VKITLGACSSHVRTTRDWLAPLRAALDAATEPVNCFFRDDDVGWRDDRLHDLLDLFDGFGLPIDLAVIPAALGGELAAELRHRLGLADGRLGTHQHGYGHRNYEPPGRRRCEFGPARTAADQLRDIATGRARLAVLLDGVVEPIFTPPWNRCTAVTGRCLAELGFRVLSREARAEPLGTPGLRELPVHVDWLKRRDGERVPREEVVAIGAAAVERGGPLGIMFHHAGMDHAEREAAAELLALLAEHESARCVRMRAVA
jgi:hypothetical protein